MSHPDFEAARSAVLDSSTDPRALAAIAEQHTSLRAVVAAHPNAYDGLLDWLDAQGDREVSAVIAGRRGRPSAAQANPVVQPTPAPTPTPAADAQSQAPAQTTSDKTKPAKTKPAKPARSPMPVARRRALMAGAIALISLGLVGGGFSGGWLLSARWASEQALPEATPSVVLVPQVPEGVRMPDLRGLARNDALQVIADAGWDPSKVTFTSEPFAGPEGVVVAQSPIFGVTEVGTIALTLSKPAVMPQTADRVGTEVVTELRNLGVNVTIAYGYDPKVSGGKVIAVDPKPGAPLPADATVTIAESGTARFLSRIQCPDNCLSSTSDLTLDGAAFTDSVYGEVSYNTWDDKIEVGTHSYQLGRHADRFMTTLGIPDDVTPTTGRVTVTIQGDGKQLDRFTVEYGTTHEVDVPVSGVLRLTIRSSFAKKPPEGMSRQRFALGDARVVGSDAEIAQLVER